MMRAMPSPELASPSNPRIRSAAGLRNRRERASTGLTLVDGAREARRALESSVEVVEAFVCEPLLAGEGHALVLGPPMREHDHQVRAGLARVLDVVPRAGE